MDCGVAKSIRNRIISFDNTDFAEVQPGFACGTIYAYPGYGAVEVEGEDFYFTIPEGMAYAFVPNGKPYPGFQIIGGWFSAVFNY
ncbi:MAG: hypothetical protein KatS3mg101_1151 [Patescibacteria group bacterium]|nr:MAG: hypothetical protein KatS3mg101_1151 [Patescibacteria group bacterium]